MYLVCELRSKDHLDQQPNGNRHLLLPNSTHHNSVTLQSFSIISSFIYVSFLCILTPITTHPLLPLIQPFHDNPSSRLLWLLPCSTIAFPITQHLHPPPIPFSHRHAASSHRQWERKHYKWYFLASLPLLIVHFVYYLCK